MKITLTYKKARELLDYLKAWERIKDGSQSGEIVFEWDKLEYDRNDDKVEIRPLP